MFCSNIVNNNLCARSSFILAIWKAILSLDAFKSGTILYINGYFLKRFHVTLGLLDMSKYTWILAYRYQI